MARITIIAYFLRTFWWFPSRKCGNWSYICQLQWPQLSQTLDSQCAISFQERQGFPRPDNCRQCLESTILVLMVEYPPLLYTCVFYILSLSINTWSLMHSVTCSLCISHFFVGWNHTICPFAIYSSSCLQLLHLPTYYIYRTFVLHPQGSHPIFPIPFPCLYNPHIVKCCIKASCDSISATVYCCPLQLHHDANCTGSLDKCPGSDSNDIWLAIDKPLGIIFGIINIHCLLQ